MGFRTQNLATQGLAQHNQGTRSIRIASIPRTSKKGDSGRAIIITEKKTVHVTTNITERLHHSRHNNGGSSRTVDSFLPFREELLPLSVALRGPVLTLAKQTGVPLCRSVQ